MLSNELAFKAQVDAATRDYVCEPHLGASSCPALIVAASAPLSIFPGLTATSYCRVPHRGGCERSSGGCGVRKGAVGPQHNRVPSIQAGQAVLTETGFPNCRSRSMRRLWRFVLGTEVCVAARFWRWMGPALWCRCSRAPRALTTGRRRWSSLERCVLCNWGVNTAYALWQGRLCLGERSPLP